MVSKFQNTDSSAFKIPGAATPSNESESLADGVTDTFWHSLLDTFEYEMSIIWFKLIVSMVLI